VSNLQDTQPCRCGSSEYVGVQHLTDKRKTVFPGQEHPNAATPDVFHEEDAKQSNRHLTPETVGVTVTWNQPAFIPNQGGHAGTSGPFDKTKEDIPDQTPDDPIGLSELTQTRGQQSGKEYDNGGNATVQDQQNGILTDATTEIRSGSPLFKRRTEK
jgi:hypothetical protein